MSIRNQSNLLTTALSLDEPNDKDWVIGAKPQTGTNLRVTTDTALVSRLRAAGVAEVLQAPPRGRAPASGRPLYILRIHPNADAPNLIDRHTSKRATPKKRNRIPYFLLVPIIEAASAEWRRQRSTISAQVDQEIESIEAQLRSTKDRVAKKRLADALQTALHADETLDAEIAKRVYTKLSNSDEAYSRYVDLIDWSAQR
jgi:hypothetical protein